MVYRGISAFALFIASLGSANADVMVSVTGSGPTGSYAVAEQILGVEWETTQAYQDVSIEVPLWCGDCRPQDPPVQVEAYLSSTIGPSTTANQLIASSSMPLSYDGTATCPFSYSYPLTSCQWITVFSGLDLAPGRYFLTLNASFGPGPGYASWMESPTATVETAPGVTTDSLGYFANNNLDPVTPNNTVPDFLFPPDSTFDTLSGVGFEFQVIADAPEPSALLLLAVPALFFIMKQRTRKPAPSE